MIYSYSRLKKYEECHTAFYRKYILELPETPSEPMVLGKAVHKAIEHTMNGESINAAVDKALSTAELPVDRNEVLKLASHPEVKNIKSNTLKQVEYHFEIPLDGPEAPIIQGYIDLWWEDFLEVTMLDWKTNRKKYTPKANHQLGLYAWALNQITGKERITASLVFLRYGQTNCYEIEQYGTEDMEEARCWALNLANEIDAALTKLNDIEYLSYRSDLFPDLFPATPGVHCEHCSYATHCYNNTSTVPSTISTLEDAEAMGKEIIILETALDEMKIRLKEWVKKNGPVKIDDQEFCFSNSVSWSFAPDKLKEFCQALGTDGTNPWDVLSITSARLKKIGWSEEKLAQFGKKKETNSFRKVKISDIA